jgi:hypothetical protein
MSMCVCMCVCMFYILAPSIWICVCKYGCVVYAHRNTSSYSRACVDHRQRTHLIHQIKHARTSIHVQFILTTKQKAHARMHLPSASHVHISHTEYYTRALKTTGPMYTGVHLVMHILHVHALRNTRTRSMHSVSLHECPSMNVRP